MKGFKANYAIATLFFLFSFTVAIGQNVQVNISEVRSAKGHIVINVFKDNETYKKELPFKKMSFDKKGLLNGKLTLNLSLDPGVYGITLLDDENENGEMDKSFIRMPKEGFGFSNFYLEKMSRPSFDDFKYTIKISGNAIAIRVKYM